MKAGYDITAPSWLPESNIKIMEDIFHLPFVLYFQSFKVTTRKNRLRHAKTVWTHLLHSNCLPTIKLQALLSGSFSVGKCAMSVTVWAESQKVTI